MKEPDELTKRMAETFRFDIVGTFLKCRHCKKRFSIHRIGLYDAMQQHYTKHFLGLPKL